MMIPTTSVAQIDIAIDWILHHRWPSGDALCRHLALGYGIWLMLDGEVQVTCAPGVYHVTTGQAFWLPPAIPRDIVAVRESEWLSIGVLVSTTELATVSLDLLAPLTWTPHREEHDRMAGWMRQLLTLSTDDDFGTKLIQEGLGRALVGTIVSHRQRHQPTLPCWLADIVRLLQADPITPIGTMAENAGYSTAQFRHLFHRYLGMAPHAFQQHCVLDNARRLLRTTDLPISRIADRLGFTSHTNFSRYFAQIYGISPTAYRRQAHLPQV